MILTRLKQILFLIDAEYGLGLCNYFKAIYTKLKLLENLLIFRSRF